MGNWRSSFFRFSRENSLTNNMSNDSQNNSNLDPRLETHSEGHLAPTQLLPSGVTVTE